MPTLEKGQKRYAAYIHTDYETKVEDVRVAEGVITKSGKQVTTILVKLSTAEAYIEKLGPTESLNTTRVEAGETRWQTTPAAALCWYRDKLTARHAEIQDELERLSRRLKLVMLERARDR